MEFEIILSFIYIYIVELKNVCHSLTSINGKNELSSIPIRVKEISALEVYIAARFQYTLLSFLCFITAFWE